MKLYSLIKNKLDEGLRPDDLKHLILDKVSLDEFESKSGEDKDEIRYASHGEKWRSEKIKSLSEIICKLLMKNLLKI